MKWLLACLATFFAFGVSASADPTPTRIVHMHVDSSFTDRERLQIVQAVATWNRTLNGQVRLEIERDEPSVIVVKRVPGSLPGPVPYAAAWTDFVGGNLINVHDDVDSKLFVPVLLHELGHVLGAEHVEQTLMSPEVEPEYLCVDPTTGRHVAEHLRLNPSSLLTCKGF